MALLVAQSAVLGKAAEVLAAGGLNKVAIAGVLGNALQESSWNPASQGDGGGGLWGFSPGGGYWGSGSGTLQGYASAHHTSWTDPATQAAYLLQHLSRSDIAALNSQSTPESAATWFMSNWERPAVATENAARREQGAREVFDSLTHTNLKTLTGPAGATGSGSSTSTGKGSYGGLSGFLLKAVLTVGLVVAGVAVAGIGFRGMISNTSSSLGGSRTPVPVPA